MEKGGEGVNRRTVLKAALLAAGVAVLPNSTRAETSPKNKRPEGLSTLDKLKKPSEQIKWFADKLGPQGSLWPMLRDGDFTDDELRVLLRSLASVSRALNEPLSSNLRDKELLRIKSSLPTLDHVPHLYTISVRNSGGQWHDFGNVSMYEYKGRPYIQSSAHVMEYVAKEVPQIEPFFRKPALLNDKPTDVTFATLSSVPVFDGHDNKIVQMPSDLDSRTCHGQLNVVMGYKNDGGAQSIAGIVLPTPEKMRERLKNFWTPGVQYTPEALEVVKSQKEGGLFLMPSFLGETSAENNNFRAAGRSGSFRLVFSPKHGQFVPASNFASGSPGVDKETGMFLGWVDSMTHVVRGLSEIDSAINGGQFQKSLTPRHVPELEPGTFEIVPGVYLRSVRRRLQKPTSSSLVTNVQK